MEKEALRRIPLALLVNNLARSNRSLANMTTSA
jgi:hypothetical protein